MPVTPKHMVGSWLPAGTRRACCPGDRAEVSVTQGHGKDDLFVVAGCQQGFLHVSLAYDLAAALLASVLELAPDLATTPVLEIQDPKGATHIFRGVSEITSTAGYWTALGPNGETVSGPHSNKGWTFRFVQDEQAEKVLSFLKLNPAFKPEGR